MVYLLIKNYKILNWKFIMKSQRLSREFFLQPTLETSKSFLGKYIVHRNGSKKIIGKIVETEAYIGTKDKASHAFKGKRTPRNEIEYAIGGHIYIYLVYGMYWQLNIVTGPKDAPECVLIRAVEPVGKNHESRIMNKELINSSNGPGKLCKYFKLNKSHYGVDLCKSKKIWLEDPVPANSWSRLPNSQIVAAKRIGIDYAGPYWANIKWRFYIKDNSFVSKK